MSDIEMLDLIKELDSMTPAAPYPCRTKEEINTIIRICKIWHMLFDKIHTPLVALKEDKFEEEEVLYEALNKICRKWKKYSNAQRRLAKKRDNTLEYNLILGNISIKAFHKNSMVDLGTLSYPKE